MGEPAPGGEWIEIGATGRAHGVRGELRVHVARRYHDAIPRLEKIYIARNEGEPRPAVIESVRRNREVYLVRLDLAPDRTAAEGFRGAALYAKPEELEEAGCEGPFPEQMAGMAVRTESGETIGTVAGVDEYPAGDMLLVMDGERELLIPAVPPIVVSVDVEKREIVVAPPPGLLELNS